jgi:hypothetical protein
MLTITETNLAGLPRTLQDQVNQNLSNREILLMCIFYYESSLLLKVESALVLTDFKLMEHRTDFKWMDGGSPISWAQGTQMVWLEEISHIEDSPSRWDRIGGDYIIIHTGPNNLRATIRFEKNITQKKKFYLELQKAVANASIRARTPVPVAQPTIPDVADQLAKLFQLYQSRAITAVEYEAAKKKLLG